MARGLYELYITAPAREKFNFGVILNLKDYRVTKLILIKPVFLNSFDQFIIHRLQVFNFYFQLMHLMVGIFSLLVFSEIFAL